MNGLTPFYIGLTLTVTMSLFAPISMAGFNPVRDFCPRLVSLIFGWGAIAIPGPKNGFWLYFIGPWVGGLVGGLIYVLMLGNHFQDGTKKGAPAKQKK